jgi:hypothetical protein
MKGWYAEAVKDFLPRYAQALRHAWAHRQQIATAAANKA